MYNLTTVILMSNQIKDGSGKGFLAKVGSDQKLYTFSTNISNAHAISNNDGQSYIIATDLLNITDTVNFSAIAYVQNTSTDKHLHLEFGRSGQTSTTQWQFLRNPITGTIVTTATPAIETNTNFTSNNVAEANSYQGFNGATVAGISAAHWIQETGGALVNLEGTIVMGPLDSIAFAAKPSVAGTITFMAMFYFDDKGET